MTVAVSVVAVCPTSYVNGPDGVTAAVGSATTVIVPVVPLIVAPRWSVIVTLNAQLELAPLGVYVNDDTLPGSVNPGHVPTTVHAYVYGGVPPVSAALTETPCPTSTVPDPDGVIVGVVNAVPTVTSTAFDAEL